MHAVTELRRGDLLATAARERRADSAPASFSEKDHWVLRALTMLALAFGFRV
jgi:hypothetical protein